MQRLEHAAELLDGPLGTPETVLGNLRDLERANRWFGGAALSRRALLRLTSGTYAGPARRRFDWRRGPLRMLDVGTGGADIPVALLDWAGRRSLPLEIHAVDSREEVVAAAGNLVAEIPRLDLDVADATRLPFPDASFDVVHCSLLLHHLDVDEAVTALREMRRVCRLGVIVNDLDRNRRALVGAWVFGHTVALRRYSRHDAPMSVRRAYRPAEVAQLATRAGLVEALRVTGFGGHRYAIAFVPADAAPAAGMDASVRPSRNEEGDVDPEPGSVP
jgi:SAM-dependent methyltransferase